MDEATPKREYTEVERGALVVANAAAFLCAALEDRGFPRSDALTLTGSIVAGLVRHDRIDGISELASLAQYYRD